MDGQEPIQSKLPNLPLVPKQIVAQLIDYIQDGPLAYDYVDKMSPYKDGRSALVGIANTELKKGNSGKAIRANQITQQYELVDITSEVQVDHAHEVAKFIEELHAGPVSYSRMKEISTYPTKTSLVDVARSRLKTSNKKIIAKRSEEKYYLTDDDNVQIQISRVEAKPLPSKYEELKQESKIINDYLDAIQRLNGRPFVRKELEEETAVINSWLEAQNKLQRIERGKDDVNHTTTGTPS
jgi:hypothetical protein